MKNLTLVLVLALAFLSASGFAQDRTGKKCKTARECQDGVFCNGVELCAMANDGKRRCQPAKLKACSLGLGQVCVESERSCKKRMCSSQNDCNDGLFCTGKRECNPTANARRYNRSTGFWGCAPKKNPCTDGMSCDENTDSCVDPNCIGRLGDEDRDGHKSIACGGDDCDDSDANRYPGNPETCDFNGHDEDCDEKTLGNRDRDHDGQVSSQCCQVQVDGSKVCGNDCDDENAMVRTGSQMCIQHGQPSVSICGKGVEKCAKGLVCYNQPNGLGVCAPK